MLSTIFQYELKHWLRQSSIYIYFGVFLFLGMLAMGANAEAFDPHNPVNSSSTLANSSFQINDVVDLYTKLVLLLLPAIFGVSIFRDFKNNVHTVLYSYPFSKRDYLLGKFLSAFLVMAGIVSAILIGLFLGTKLPSVNTQLLLPNNILAYLQGYLVYLLPNVLVFGIIVFAVVIYTRNVYSGFVTVLLLLALQAIMGTVFGGMDNRYWMSLFDPTGKYTSFYYLQSWTKIELNTQLVPVKGVVIFNRLLWLSIAGGVFGMMYRTFSFSQNALTWSFRKKKGDRFVKENFENVQTFEKQKLNFQFSFLQNLKTSWALSNVGFQYIIKNWMFSSILFIGFVFVLFAQLQMNAEYGFKSLPTTFRMLQIPAFLFSGAILVLTFLFSGMLVHRDRLARMNHLVDITPIPNWIFLLSNFIAIVKMQILLLAFILIAGVIAQTILGYYNYEIGVYLFRLYVVMLPSFVIWALAAFFVQTLFTNPYLGFFILLLSSVGASFIPEQLGLEHSIFKFNVAPEYSYSDLNGYGDSLRMNFLLRFYWLIFGSVLFLGSLLIWVRGNYFTLKERLSIAQSRWGGRLAMFVTIFAVSFLSMGFGIYYQDVWGNDDFYDTVNWDEIAANNEKQFKPFENIPQPNINAVKIDVDIFPKTKNFKAKGVYTLFNNLDRPMDTLIVNYSFDELMKYSFEEDNDLIIEDTVLRYGVHVLKNSLASGDSLLMNFEVQNRKNTFFHNKSNVVGNGTFLLSHFAPKLGYKKIELRNTRKREKYGLPALTFDLALPSDSTALSSSNTDWISRFEATVSTAEDQIAIAPGYLQKEWTANGRRYFQYKMNSKIRSYFGFNSGQYEVAKDDWNGISLEVYYDENHPFNVDRMMRGLKSALAYNIENFGRYQHQQARIIEFPITYGAYNTVFANSVPFSEGTFIVDVDDEKEEVIDFPFKVAAHEIAHQWWAHQFITADVKGKKVLTESMAEYVAVQVLENEYGIEKKRKYLEYTMDSYFNGRRKESKEEMPLIHALPEQKYLNYRKGVVAMCTMSEYIGEKNFNRGLRAFLDRVRFNEAPYTTSLELIDFIRKETPDSLQYLIRDLFETITFYDNSIEDWKATRLDDGKYQVEIKCTVSKYRTDGNGKKSFEEYGDSISDGENRSLPLADFLEIGVFGENGNVLLLEKRRFSKIKNTVVLIVDKKPMEVGIDPYRKLFDTEFSDNRK